MAAAERVFPFGVPRRARRSRSADNVAETTHAPAYFEGRRTVNRLRPFFRRRLKVARPQRVDIRSRNPWVLMRRLLRGRYVGLPIQYSEKIENQTAKTSKAMSRLELGQAMHQWSIFLSVDIIPRGAES